MRNSFLTQAMRLSRFVRYSSLLFAAAKNTILNILLLVTFYIMIFVGITNCQDLLFLMINFIEKDTKTLISFFIIKTDIILKINIKKK